MTRAHSQPQHTSHLTDIDLLCAHAGQGSGDGSPLVTPLVQSTTYCRDGIESTAPHA